MKTNSFVLAIGVALISFAIFSYCTTPPPVTKGSICIEYPENTISTLPILLISDMVSKYQEKQLSAVKEGLREDLRKQLDNNQIDSTNFKERFPEVQDAQSIWFDLETLKTFLYHIEHITIENDSTKTNKDLGVRIYYTSYPKRETWDSIPEYRDALLSMKNDQKTVGYEEKHTLVMIPTIRQEKNGRVGNFDFNPLFGKDTYDIDLRSAISGDSINRNLLLSVGGFTNIEGMQARNHGGLIPPRDPEEGELLFNPQQ